MNISPDKNIKTNVEAHAARLISLNLRQRLSDNKDKDMYTNSSLVTIANDLSAAADQHLILADIPSRGVGGEFIVQRDPYSKTTLPLPKKIDRVNVDASLDRLGLLDKSGVVNIGLDLAEAIQATNSAEQMLAHQMAAAHRSSVDLLAEAGNTRDTVERCRLTNTAARLMDTYQKAMMTLHKTRNGGQQIVTVQHVQVRDGGQAIVNGGIQGGAMTDNYEGEVK